MTGDLPTYLLNDGARLPCIGFGTYPLRGAEGVAAIVSAVECGYRLIDSAVNYENEAEVGRAVRACGLPREEVRVATKIPGRDHAFGSTVASVEGSLTRLGLDYLDLVLIHWPNPSVGLYPQAWRALVRLRERGLVRSIGVSNFAPEHLERIVDETGVTPAVNQIECHPLFPQEGMLAEHARRGIVTQSWSPLGKRAAPFSAAPVVAAAGAHGVSGAQVMVRWHLQRGCLPLPKSATPARQRENMDVFSFELSEEQVAGITALGRSDGRLFGGDPASHEEM